MFWTVSTSVYPTPIGRGPVMPISTNWIVCKPPEVSIRSRDCGEFALLSEQPSRGETKIEPATNSLEGQPELVNSSR
jgi:hypothetical protein